MFVHEIVRRLATGTGSLYAMYLRLESPKTDLSDQEYLSRFLFALNVSLFASRRRGSVLLNDGDSIAYLYAMTVNKLEGGMSNPSTDLLPYGEFQLRSAQSIFTDYGSSINMYNEFFLTVIEDAVDGSWNGLLGELGLKVSQLDDLKFHLNSAITWSHVFDAKWSAASQRITGNRKAPFENSVFQDALTRFKSSIDATDSLWDGASTIPTVGSKLDELETLFEEDCANFFHGEYIRGLTLR